MLSEEMRRLREKLAQYGDRSLTGNDLAHIIDEVSSDMRAADSGPEPYDLSAPPRPTKHRGSGSGSGMT